MSLAGRWRGPAQTTALSSAPCGLSRFLPDAFWGHTVHTPEALALVVFRQNPSLVSAFPPLFPRKAPHRRNQRVPLCLAKS